LVGPLNQSQAPMVAASDTMAAIESEDQRMTTL
jgi:hypothetical protein